MHTRTCYIYTYIHTHTDTTHADDKSDDVGPMEHKTLDQVRPNPLDLPASFEWYDIDVDSDEDVRDILYTIYLFFHTTHM